MEAMLNLEDGGCADAIAPSQFPLREHSLGHADGANLLRGERALGGLWFADKWLGALGDMVRGLLPATIGGGGGDNRRRGNAPLARCRTVCTVFWAVFSPFECGSDLRRAFRGQALAAMSNGHLGARRRRGAMTRCSVTTIGQIGQAATQRAVMGNPPTFRLGIVPIARFDYSKARAQPQSKKLRDPVVLVHAAMTSTPDMGIEPLTRVQRPSHITNRPAAWIGQGVDVPCARRYIHAELYHVLCLCGYQGEHTMPEGWVVVPWKAKGGYGSQGKGRGRENAAREVLWFSPACLRPERQQRTLWATA